MGLAPDHQRKVLDRGFSDQEIAFLSKQNGHLPILQSLSAEEIQAEWLDAFPSMEGNQGGALLLRFNECTVSLKPDQPDWDEKHQRFAKYLYAIRPGDQPNSQIRYAEQPSIIC